MPPLTTTTTAAALRSQARRPIWGVVGGFTGPTVPARPGGWQCRVERAVRSPPGIEVIAMMNNRMYRRVLYALSLGLLAACGDGGKAKIEQIQRQADDRVAQADRAARERIAAAQQQMDATKAQLEAVLAKTKTDAEGAIRDAQASADEQAKMALLALTRARDAYKAEARVKLADLNKDTREVATKAAKATAKVKASVDRSMQEIAKEQKELAKEIGAFDAATLETFGTLKARVDRDLARLKLKVQSIRAKVP
jgi:hypothetical protein